MKFILQTKKGDLIFKIYKHFHFEIDVPVVTLDYILFGKDEILPKTAKTTESLQIYSNGNSVLVNTTITSLYEGFEVVGRMVAGQEILREMVKSNSLSILDFEFNDEDSVVGSDDRSDGEDLIIHDDNVNVDTADDIQDNQDDTISQDKQDSQDNQDDTVDHDNPYVIGLAPPPESTVKNVFLSRDIKNQRLNFVPNRVQVDGKGRKVCGLFFILGLARLFLL
jgi:hypothetical protein